MVSIDFAACYVFGFVLIVVSSTVLNIWIRYKRGNKDPRPAEREVHFLGRLLKMKGIEKED